MSETHSFYSLHRQGMIRAGVCTPSVRVADPMANARSAIDLAKEGDAKGADLLVFPELNVTSYAIDDLHLQDAVLDATEAGIAEIVAASATLKPDSSTALLTSDSLCRIWISLPRSAFSPPLRSMSLARSG